MCSSISFSPLSWLSFLRSRRFCQLFVTALLLFSAPTHAAQPENVRSNKHKAKAVASHSSKHSSKSKVYRSIGGKKSNKHTARRAHGRALRQKNRRSHERVETINLPSSSEKLSNQFVHQVASPTDKNMEPAIFSRLNASQALIPRLPDFSSSYRGKVAAVTEKQEFVQFSIDPDLQEYAHQLVAKVTIPHIAIVAMEPKTGRILAMAGKSVSIKNIVTHAGFPAASLFKVVTSSAAIERSGANPNDEIFFRGGTYELGPTNYNPNPVSDRRSMSMTEALGKSCNPVFSRVGLKFLNPSLLRAEASAFGFNTDLKTQMPLPISSATIPNDDYDFGRTAAGFGDVFLSPLHAAAIVSTFANGGKFPIPTIIDQVISPDGDIIFKSQPTILHQAVTPQTAKTLLQMMTATTTIGTSKREFAGKVPWEVAAKTGTLKGENPVGLNNWFIGTAPLNNPKIAVAVVVVNPNQPSSKASHIGKLILQRYLG